MRITDPATWEKAKDVIADALKRPASERAAYVRERCPDPALRAEIDAMLDAYEEDPEFLEEPALTDPHDEAELADLQPGTRVGPYVIIDRLGRGGMGEVFLSSDSRLHRKVALKCLIASRSAGDDRQSRILHEARAAARINHPNVATVHDVVEHEGRAFIVMEYVEGESLAARLKRERVPIDRVVAIGRQLAAALAAAHATNIIHRDLKPGNVQLLPDGSVKVLDFGVAKAQAMLSSATDRTTTAVHVEGRGAQVGTPGYMAPEQLLGRDADERSDIFSLGVILFETTTGRRPFTGSDPLELVVKLARGSLGTDLDRAGVPRAMAEVITRTLEIDAKDRFQTAAEVESTLAHLERELAPTALTQIALAAESARSRTRLHAFALILLAPFVLAFFGYLTSVAFDQTFDRVPPFGGDSPASWMLWGFRSVLPIVFYMGAMAIAWQTARFVVRLLALWAPIEVRLTSLRRSSRQAAARLGLDDQVVLAQAIAAIGFVALALVAWRFRDLILAYTGSISMSPAVRFLPLRSDDLSDARWYRISLDALMLVFGLMLFRLSQGPPREPSRRGIGGLALVATVLTLTTLMNVVPYRILWGNRFERIDYGGVRCYVIGEHVDDWLLYCPDTAPPRNRVIRRTDPAAHRLGIVESVFTPTR